MDSTTLIAAADFSHSRLLGILDTIEKSGQDVNKVLAWRPGVGRAHIAWQAMHCAATHDRYVNVRLKGSSPKDENIVTNFAGGSTPSDTNIPTLSAIREAIAARYADFKNYIATASPADLEKKMMFGTTERTVAESIILLTWHEAHHQGQIHITWNLYKAAHGVA